jgi:uncharacterized protein YwgA
MGRSRTTDEVFADELVTLLLLHEGEQAGVRPIDRLRLQKLCFLLEHGWFTERRKGLNYRFFRYRYGPFTPELYQTEVDLAVAGLIEDRGSWTFALTDDGRRFAEALREELKQEPDNHSFLADLERVARDDGALDTSKLLEKVYAMETVPLGWREAWPLRDIPIGLDLTRPLELEEATAALTIPEGWRGTLALRIDERADDEVALPHGV